MYLVRFGDFSKDFFLFLMKCTKIFRVIYPSMRININLNYHLSYQLCTILGISELIILLYVVFRKVTEGKEILRVRSQFFLPLVLVNWHVVSLETSGLVTVYVKLRHFGESWFTLNHWRKRPINLGTIDKNLVTLFAIHFLLLYDMVEQFCKGFSTCLCEPMTE